MPQAPNFIEIYDFETAIETALETFCTEALITAFTSKDDPQFLKERPRIEFVLAVGDEAGHNSIIEPHLRPDSFNATLTGSLITKPQDAASEGRSQHATYRAAFRNIMAKARLLLSTTRADLLPYHTIQDITATGTTSLYKSEDGHWMTQLQFNIRFNIRPDAWPAEEE